MNSLNKSHMCVYLLYCIMHGSVVLGNGKQQCINDVHRLFDSENDPKQHFTTAFTDYNRVYFNKQTPPNSNGHGYFEDLINRIGEIDHLISSPKDYCKQLSGNSISGIIAFYNCQGAMFTLFANKTLDRGEEMKRVMDMTATAAFKNIYLRYILSDMTFDKLYPPKEYQLNMNDATKNRIREYNESRETLRNNRETLDIIGRMQAYFINLNEAVQQIAENVEFRKVEDYCASAAGASTSTSSNE